MTRRLFLHIGMMKSGTTYLQRLCDLQVGALQDGGVLWAGGSAAQQTAAVLEFRGSSKSMPGDEGAWERLRHQVARHDGDALLSHELLASLPARQVRPFVEAFVADEVYVIVTVRDLSRVIPSRWQETTQNRGTTRWNEYLDIIVDEHSDHPAHRGFWRQTDVGRVLRNWASVAHPERMRLITVPPPGLGRDLLWKRFAEIIGVDPELAARTDAFSNTALGAVSSELMLRMNRRVAELPWPEYRMAFKSGMAKEGLAKRASEEPKLAFPPDRWDWVEAQTKRMMDEITDVGPVIIGDLEELRPTPPSNGITDPTWEPTDAELLAAALDGIELLAMQVGQTRLQLRQAQAELREIAEPSTRPWWRRVAGAARKRLPFGRR